MDLTLATFQTVLVRAIEAQKLFDSSTETEYECELVDIIFAAIRGWKTRSRKDMKLLLEEGKVILHKSVVQHVMLSLEHTMSNTL